MILMMLGMIHITIRFLKCLVIGPLLTTLRYVAADVARHPINF